MAHAGRRKTTACVELAQLFPDSTVFLIDPDDGVRKIVEGHFGGFEQLPNLLYYPVDAWDKPNMAEDDPFVGVVQAYEEVKASAKPGDFFCIDMVGQMYELSKDDYVQKTRDMTYDENAFREKMKLRAETQLAFGGLSPDDWGLIKASYDNVVWHATKRLPCNIVYTSSVRQIMMKRERNAQTREVIEVPLEKGVDPAFVRLGVRPDTEKRLPYEVDTVLYLDNREIVRGSDVTYTWTGRYVTKDRGANMSNVRTFEFDGDTPFWVAYCASKGMDIGKAPGK